MSKVVSVFYCALMPVCAIGMFATVSALFAGFFEFPDGIALSGIPLAVLLLLAARLEWRRRLVSGPILTCVIAAIVLIPTALFFGHFRPVFISLLALHLLASGAGIALAVRRSSKAAV